MSRLGKGQRARSVQARSETVRASVLARLEVLDRAIQAAAVDAHRAAHFVSFEAFARWHEPALGVTRLTPKTLRRHVDAVFAGGQSALLLRLHAAAALAQEPSARPQGPARRQHPAGDRDDELVDHVHHFCQRYLDLLERMKRLAPTSEGASASLAKHFRLFGAGVPTLRRVK